jgi:phosphopantetheine binding protein
MSGLNPAKSPTDDTDVLVATAVRRRWCEVLDRPEAGDQDDFFLCGGHSLLAFRLTESLREDLGASIPVSMVFEARTLTNYQQAVADLARCS